MCPFESAFETNQAAVKMHWTHKPCGSWKYRFRQRSVAGTGDVGESARSVIHDIEM